MSKYKTFRLNRSLFTKIIITFLAAYITLSIIESYAHHRLFDRKKLSKVHSNALNYCRYILDDIGSPTDTTTARRVVDSLAIDLRIRGSAFEWTSNPEIKTFDEVNLPEPEEGQGFRIGQDDGFYVLLRQSGYTYLFRMEKRREGMAYQAEIHLMLSFFFSAVIILTIYLIIRWQLKPITTLRLGVEKLALGDHAFRLETRREDELGQLIMAFNHMVQQISERLKARDQLLLDVSHELRSPLTRMKVALEFLPDLPARTNLTEDIREVEAMITEILESARLDSGHGGLHIRNEDLAGLLRQTATEFSGRKPGLTLTIPEQPVPLPLDADRIIILLRNILDNALKFSSASDQAVEVQLSGDEEQVTVSVKDYGPGIPEPEIPFIFEPFYRVDKSRNRKTGGFGLGLSIAAKIAEAHQAVMQIESPSGSGTRIILTFNRNRVSQNS